MLLGAYLLENFWSSAFQTMQLQAEWQAVATLCIEIVSVSMGNYLLFICLVMISDIIGVLRIDGSSYRRI